MSEHPFDNIRISWQRDEIGRHHGKATLALEATCTFEAPLFHERVVEQAEEALRHAIKARILGELHLHVAELQHAIMRLELQLPINTKPYEMLDGRMSYDTERNPEILQAEAALAALFELANK